MLAVAFFLSFISITALAVSPDANSEELETVEEAAGRHPRLWRPRVGTKWQIILSHSVNISAPLTPEVPIWDIDGENSSKESIKFLQKGGRKVICYFSAGTYERDREDSDILKNYTGNSLAPDWPHEYYLKVNEKPVRDVMAKRIAKLAAKGCNAIDPDNMDFYSNNNGLNLTADDSFNYLGFLSHEARKHGMSTGLKNSEAIISRAIAARLVQFSVNEQCDEINNCQFYDEFIKHRIPVFNIEYINAKNKTHPTRCPSNKGFSSVIKKMNLNGWVQSCSGVNATTATLDD